MRWLIGFLCLAGTLPGQDLSTAQVQVSYKELRALIESAEASRTPPPVSQAVLSAKYSLKSEKGLVSGTVEYDVQTFRDGVHVVPLIDDGMVLESVEPRDAILVAKDGFYALSLEGRQRARVALRFAAPPGKSSREVAWKVNPAVTTVVEVASDTGPARVEGGIAAGEGKWRLGKAREIRLAFFEPEPEAPRAATVSLPAVVREAKSEMRLVADGAVFNRMRWRIRHEAPHAWKVALPGKYELVSAKVAGKPAAPARVDDKTLEFRLPEPRDEETEVEISYTQKIGAFNPLRGDFSLSLPSTELLIETLDWKLTIPSAYETVAAEGNVEFTAGGNAGEVSLRKELCQGDSPSVRIFYQKPESNR